MQLSKVSYYLHAILIYWTFVIPLSLYLYCSSYINISSIIPVGCHKYSWVIFVVTFLPINNLKGRKGMLRKIHKYCSTSQSKHSRILGKLWQTSKSSYTYHIRKYKEQCISFKRTNKIHSLGLFYYSQMVSFDSHILLSS